MHMPIVYILKISVSTFPKKGTTPACFQARSLKFNHTFSPVVSPLLSSHPLSDTSYPPSFPPLHLIFSSYHIIAPYLLS
eukprot:768404-Hanusia_phi.AAC.9